MTQFNLRKITANSWIANTNGTPMAYIHKSETEYLFLTPESSEKFESMDDIKKFLGGKVTEQTNDSSMGLETVALEHIEGFPVKHTNISIEQAGAKPIYVRGKTQHVAGYWCIKFSKRWVPSFCPLLRTIEQYQSDGPFKSRLEMMSNLANLNRSVG